ncbi:MAG TPA: hypothetical protein VF471_07960 [Pseudoxanthomonas sp.]
MSLKRGSWLALRSLLAIGAGLVVLPLVNLAGGALADLTGFPAAGEGRLAWDLGWLFTAGSLAAWTVARLAPRAARAHAAALFALMLVVSVLAVAQLGEDWPRWFSAGVLIALPLQVGLGTWWALRSRGRT